MAGGALRTRWGRLLVAEWHGAVAGYASVMPAGLLGQPFLAYLCVRPDLRRRGVARTLVRAVQTGTTGRMLLTSTEDWCAEAHSLFTSVGGQRVGELAQVNRDGSTEVFYQLPLGAPAPEPAPAPLPDGVLPRVHVVCGQAGLRALGEVQPAAVVVVDVLCFSTCVDVACARGAVVQPLSGQEDRPARLARELNATLVRRREKGGLSLSPASLAAVDAGQTLLLRSPDGGALSLLDTPAPWVLAGCLRNASAVAAAARQAGGTVVIVAADEHSPTGPARFALEDWLGAGAIVHALGGRPDATACAAQAAFVQARNHLSARLADTPAGRELIDSGWPQDVAWAASLDISTCQPRRVAGVYVNVNTRLTAAVDVDVTADAPPSQAGDNPSPEQARDLLS